MLRRAARILRVTAWHPDGHHLVGHGLRSGAAIALLREHQKRSHFEVFGNG